MIQSLAVLLGGARSRDMSSQVVENIKIQQSGRNRTCDLCLLSEVDSARFEHATAGYKMREQITNRVDRVTGGNEM